MMFMSLREDFKALPRSLYLLFVCSLVSRLGTLVYPFLTIYFANVRHFDLSVVGLLISIGSLGMIVGNFLGGFLADKWSVKYTMMLSFLIKVFGYLGLLVWHESDVAAVVFLFVALAGMGIYGPAGSAAIAHLSEGKSRQFAYTVDYVFRNVGMGLGPLLGGVLVQYSYNWIFLGDISASVVCLMLLALGLRVSRAATVAGDDHATERRHFFQLLWAYPALAGFGFGGVFLIGVLFGMEYLMPLMVKNVFGASTVVIGAVYSLNAAVILCGSFIIERVLRGRNEILMMLVSAGFWLLGMLVVVVGFNSVSLLLGVAFWTLGEIVYSIVAPAFISKRAPLAYKGRFLALVDFSVSAARLVLPMSLGVVWQHYGLAAALWLLTALPAVGFLLYAGLYFLLRRQDRVSATHLPQNTSG